MFESVNIKVGNFSVEKVPMNVFEVLTGFHITTNCSGKMEGLWAFNTSCLTNPFCQDMQKNRDLVCSKCYAKQYLGYRKSCDKKFTDNFYAINKEVWKYVPDLETAMFNNVLKVVRFDEFGELGSVEHMINYLLVAIANPNVTFGFWTKRPNLVRHAMKILGLDKIPDNLCMVGSSFRLNEVGEAYNDLYRDLFDHVFTVYSAKYVIDNGVVANCAGKSCIRCMKCYQKGGVRDIKEIIKNEHQGLLRRINSGTVDLIDGRYIIKLNINKKLK